MSSMCFNHPEKIADNICHNCGNHFCQTCLSEGVEYYYCTRSECQDVLKLELVPAQIICPNCSHPLDLNFEERSSQKIHCPHCEALIDFKNKDEKITEPDEYVEIISSFNQGDLALIKSMLDDAQINYYSTGENFLSVDPLIQPAKLYVLKEQYVEATELLKDFNLHIFGASAKNEDDSVL